VEFNNRRPTRPLHNVDLAIHFTLVFKREVDTVGRHPCNVYVDAAIWTGQRKRAVDRTQTSCKRTLATVLSRSDGQCSLALGQLCLIEAPSN
jgi:hypothetical protein